MGVVGGCDQGCGWWLLLVGVIRGVAGGCGQYIYVSLPAPGGRLVGVMNSRLSSRSCGFSEDEVLKIFTDICHAVARLHHRTKPIVHRDIKVTGITTLPHLIYHID